MSRGRNTTTKVGGGGGGGWWHIPQCTNNTCILNHQLSKSGHQLSKSGGARAPPAPPPPPPPPSISATGEELDWAIYSLQKELSEAVSVLKNYDWLFSYTTHDIFPYKQFKPPTGQLLPTIWFKQNITKCQSL